MTNTRAVATGNAKEEISITKTTCRECGETMMSAGCAMVACPKCSLIQYAGIAKAEGSLVSAGQLIGAYCEPCADVIMREYGEKLGEVWGFAPYDFAGHPPNCIRCEGVR